ncbi:hypothetical protein [Hahella sp. HN01]|uniref:hypothetical protein n=1 Tax=Hahella sp. HN01 TaxID=2847262 RepID=UPI001C1EF654|nr:hypothetical protein [Hahella sp. HN01]MBU6950714.1 hypothetical protein [Hahella sp. HN01]
MSATNITALIGGVIILVLLLIYLGQWREKAKDARQRQLNALLDRLRLLKALATGLPPQYAAKDIRLLVVARAQETIKELANLGHRGDHESQAEEWEVIKENINSQADFPQLDLQNQAVMQEVRKLLKGLYKFIEVQVKKGRIEKKAGVKHLLNTQFLIVRSLADSHVNKAKHALATNRPRVAIHHYHDAIEALGKIEKNPLAQKSMLIYRQRIKELEKLATEAAQTKSEAVAEGSDRLSAQLDKMMTEEEKWKKKQSYD